MSEQTTCKCGHSCWQSGLWLPRWTHHAVVGKMITDDAGDFCRICGDRLNADGTVTQMVPANIVAGCPICGDSVDVGDIEVSQDGTETVVYVSNCRRCEEQAAQDAYSRGMYVGRSGR